MSEKKLLFNKYIMENGIIKLIFSYIKPKINKIYELMHNFSNSLYSEQKMSISNPIEEYNFIICAITNDFFVIVIFRNMWSCGQKTICMYNCNFNKTNKFKYVKILNKLMTMHIYEFETQYHEILKRMKKIIVNDCESIL